MNKEGFFYPVGIVSNCLGKQGFHCRGWGTVKTKRLWCGMRDPCATLSFEHVVRPNPANPTLGVG